MGHRTKYAGSAVYLWFFDRQHTFLGTNSRFVIPLSWGCPAITVHTNQVHIGTHEHHSILLQGLHFVFLHYFCSVLQLQVATSPDLPHRFSAWEELWRLLYLHLGIAPLLDNSSQCVESRYLVG
jgi:hypothetical protein